MSSFDPFRSAADERCEICGSTTFRHELHYVLDTRPDEPREVFAKVAGHAGCLPKDAFTATEAVDYMGSMEARAVGHRLLTL